MLKEAASFFLTIPGPKMIYEFGELGYDISINYGGDRTDPKPVHWDYYDNPYRKHLYQVFSALAELRVSEDLFETSDFSISLMYLLKTIHLNSTGMKATILGNYDVVNDSITPAFQHTGTWYDYFSGKAIEIDDVNAKINLLPGEYHIYTDVQLETPDITPLGIKDYNSSNGNIKIFPNPTNSNISLVPNSGGTLYFTLYDLTGKQLYKNQAEVQTNQICSFDLKEENHFPQQGLYIYKVVLNQTVSEGKLILK